MSDKIKCPLCGSTERFSITATTSVFVNGSDYLSPVETGGDNEYDDGSMCVCSNCGYNGLLCEFRRAVDVEVLVAAREQYQDDDIKIDNDADVRRAEGGSWVAAWVWVPEGD